MAPAAGASPGGIATKLAGPEQPGPGHSGPPRRPKVAGIYLCRVWCWPEPRLDSSTAILDTSRHLSTALDSSTASTAAVKLSSRQLLDSFSTARQRCRAPLLSRLSSCQLDSSTARQLDSSTARQLRLGLPCMNWWLHLMGWLYLRSIHQGRCPLTSVAIKGVHIGSSMPCTVRPPSRGHTLVEASLAQ